MLGGKDWTEVARIVLHRDQATDTDRTRRCWESHLIRARWMTKRGYRRILEQAIEEITHPLALSRKPAC